MLTIQFGKTIVDLGDAKLAIVLTSPYPLMFVGQQPGNYIFNFSLPATDKLREIFGFAHRPARGKIHNYRSEPYTVNAAGYQFSGTAQVVMADPDTYEVFCPVGNGDFNVLSKKLKLPEIDLGGDRPLTQLEVANAGMSKGVLIYLLEPDYFTGEQLISFDAPVTEDLAYGSFSSFGQAWTVAQNIELELRFDIYIDIVLGYLSLQVLVNASVVSTHDLIPGHNTSLYTFEALTNDVVTYRISYQAVPANNDPDPDYAVDAEIGAHSTFSARQAAMDEIIQDSAINRYPDSDFATFPLENPYVASKWPDATEEDELTLKDLYFAFFRVVNYYHNGRFPSYLTRSWGSVKYNAGNVFIPFPYIAYIVKRIAHHFKYRIENNVFEDELKYAVLINHFVRNRFIDDAGLMFMPADSFNLADHVPDWTVHDFLQQLCNLFGLGYEIDNNSQTIEFNFLVDILASEDVMDISHLVAGPAKVNFDEFLNGYRIEQVPPPADELMKLVNDISELNFLDTFDLLSDLPETAEINDLCFLNFLNQYMIWQFDAEAKRFGWLLYGPHFVKSISFVEGVPVVSTKLCPVLMRNLLDNVIDPVNDRRWLLPASHQPGQFEGAPETYKANWGPAVAWYHGLKNDSLGNPYPLASSGTLNQAGTYAASHNLTLTLDPDDGNDPQVKNSLYHQKWKSYLGWRAYAHPVTVAIVPDKHFFSTFRFRKKLMINGVTYLATQLRGNVGPDGPEVFELSLLVL